MDFSIKSKFSPQGDQPKAIAALVRGLEDGAREQTLLGVTGSGKTATMAYAIQQIGRPALVLAHNKTLAAQLCGEFQEFFPENAVEYFVSYYDYYQPEAYLATSDTYIEKDATVNDEIDKLRHAATTALFERRDVVIVASVSCIYGLGSPEAYKELCVSIRAGAERDRQEILRKLVGIQYQRNDMNFTRGTFRVRGEVLEVLPASHDERAIRIEFDGDRIERILEVDVLTGEILGSRHHVAIYPASHYVTAPDKRLRAITTIEQELEQQLRHFRDRGKLLEAQRIEQRTRHDMEMLQEIGFCPGIENYSRHLTGRPPGAPPYTLLDFFPKDFVLFVDESHQSLPQVRGMYAGDRSRKESLVEYGFRLPSAFDNRPLRFDEFMDRLNQVVYVSATPSDFELSRSQQVVEQIVRPTGLVDPQVEVRPTRAQVDDLLAEVRQCTARGQRTLVTTLTKRMAEELTEYLREVGVKVRYLHSDVETIERMQIIRDLRLGVFDVLVGINLLREGLDLPEVALVAILDADKEGYLRSTTSLVQTIGRAARNLDGRVILYADQVTDSMARAIDETDRRRRLQTAFNEEHGITPTSVEKAVREVIEATKTVAPQTIDEVAPGKMKPKELVKMLDKLRREMREAARALEFERAAVIRDLIAELETKRAEKRMARR